MFWSVRLHPGFGYHKRKCANTGARQTGWQASAACHRTGIVHAISDQLYRLEKK